MDSGLGDASFLESKLCILATVYGLWPSIFRSGMMVLQWLVVILQNFPMNSRKLILDVIFGQRSGLE